MGDVKDWWNNASAGYQSDFNLPVDIHYGPSAPNEDELCLLGDLQDKSVLELGCGGAQCSVAMAKRGANVIGVDFSSEQLKFARELAVQNDVDVTFLEHDITDLSPIDTASQDIVFSAFVFLYIEDRKRVFEEALRVLKPNGLFVFSVEHPMYRKVNPKTLTLHESYFVDGTVVDDWGEFGKTNYYPYTMSSLFNLLVDTGFQIERIIEPDSRIRYEYDPWFNLYGIFVPNLLDMVPPTLIYKGVKPRA